MTPRRAPVRPRVTSTHASEGVLLEDALESLLASSKRGSVLLDGPPGSGKTTALEHLAAVFPGDDRLALIDDASADDLVAWSGRRVVVFSAKHPPSEGVIVRWSLCPWTDDDLIEYAVHKHGSSCNAIMERVYASPRRERLRGNPELWAIVIDRLALDESIPSVEVALRKHLETVLVGKAARRARFVSKAIHTGSRRVLERLREVLTGRRFDDAVLHVLRHVPVQLLLEGDAIVEELRTGGRCRYLENLITDGLIEELSARLADDRAGLDHLLELANNARRLSSMATILHACCPGWRPREAIGLHFSHAVLPGVDWQGIRLPGVNLNRAALRGANLTGVDFEHGHAWGADLSDAEMAGANLAGLQAGDANLSGAVLVSATLERAMMSRANLSCANLTRANLKAANLRHADLEDADFSGANLAGADLEGSTIGGAKFTEAVLEGAGLHCLDLRKAILCGARFAHASLSGSNLEYTDLIGADFRGARLVQTNFTGTCCHHADFRDAKLHGASLADVDWEEVDLRNADLSGSTFHMGSTRGGLIFSPVASYGTRTGFYRGDDEDRHFKSAEEIRKADLRGADLRGARVLGVDFYLVDLREAIYDEPQLDHFKRCGAILDASTAT